MGAVNIGRSQSGTEVSLLYFYPAQPLVRGQVYKLETTISAAAAAATAAAAASSVISLHLES